MMKKNNKGGLTGIQNYLRVDEIKNGLLFLKDGSVHKILQANSINFYLRSEDEQNVIIGGFQEVLNTLAFPIQILLQSRKIDLESYLESIEGNISKEQDPLIKSNMESYLSFLRDMVSSASVMDKNFYIIVSYYPSVIKTSFLDNLFGPSKKNVTNKEIIETLEVLEQRCNSVKLALESIEVICRELQTKEIIELFYATYNQDVVKPDLSYNDIS
ncbi:MAG: TraC family protein [Patescibacteria group bacterium]|nr:hypothetical protein [Patescibacteria group bacterium]